jgi:hypothetical protein
LVESYAEDIEDVVALLKMYSALTNGRPLRATTALTVPSLFTTTVDPLLRDPEATAVSVEPLGAPDVQVVPLLVRTFPAVPGATV